MVNDYTIYDEIGRASNDRAFRSLYWSRSSHIFSQCLRLISDEYMLEINKHVRWIQLQVNATDHRCGTGISSIFDTLFRYLPIFLTVLQYWVPLNIPLGEFRKSSIKPPSLINHPPSLHPYSTQTINMYWSVMVYLGWKFMLFLVSSCMTSNFMCLTFSTLCSSSLWRIVTIFLLLEKAV